MRHIHREHGEHRTRSSVRTQMKTSAEYVSCAMLAAVTALTAAAAAVILEPDDESDSAPFTVGVEHGDGRRCSAALVSLRTALTSARCASGDDDEMWARAAGPGPAPRAARVVRVVLATRDMAPSSRAWGANVAARDLALLELATALGGARSILMATSRAAGAACAVGAEGACYLVRALSWDVSGARLRIVELKQREARECWPPPPPSSSPAAVLSVSPQALCLTGPDLCESDRGAGVVCSGELCGVLSGSRGEGPCGTPHAAVSVPRWRRFLHCAHTSGACGRDGECAQLCSERWLTEEKPEGAEGRRVVEPAAPRAPGEGLHSPDEGLHSPDEGPHSPDEGLHSPDEGLHSPERTTFVDISEGVNIETTWSSQVVTVVAPTRSTAPAPAAPPLTQEGTGTGARASTTARHTFEFEPNRADFTAGEYDDNMADYIAQDETTAPPITTVLPSTSSLPTGHGHATMLARISPATTSYKMAAAAAAPPSMSTLPALLLYLTSSIYVF